MGATTGGAQLGPRAQGYLEGYADVLDDVRLAVDPQPLCDLCNLSAGPLTKVSITSTNYRYLCRRCAVGVLRHFHVTDVAYRDEVQICADQALNAGLRHPFTPREETR